MAGRLEIAKDYLLLCTERITGIDAWREMETAHPPDEKGHKRFTHILGGVMQVIAPIASRWGISRVTSNEASSTPSLDAGKFFGSLYLEGITHNIIFSNSHNLEEFIILIMVFNAAAHVIMDIGETIGNRTDKSRLSATTLAV